MKILQTVLIGAILATSSNLSMADEKQEDQIKYRQSAMTFMRWNMGIIKNQVVTNPDSYNKDQVQAAANVIAAISNSGLGRLFSAGTETGTGWKETMVKPEFFKEPDEVKKLAKAFTEEANLLAKLAASGQVSDIQSQFDKTFEACKACHKKYRKKEKK